MEYERAYGGDGYETDAEGNQRSTPMIIEIGQYCIDIDDGMDDSSGGNGSNSSGRDSGDQQRRNAATSQPSSPNRTLKERECDGLLSQAQEASAKSSAALDSYNQYKSDPNRLARLEQARAEVMTGGQYAWAVAFSGMGATPAGRIFGSTKYGSVVADFEFARQAGIDVWNGAYGTITSRAAFDLAASGVGTASTVLDISARVAQTSFGGARATAFANGVGRVNPYIALATGFGSFLSATERYQQENRDFRLYEEMQQDTLNGFMKQSQSFGKTADNLLALWKQKGCDKL